MFPSGSLGGHRQGPTLSSMGTKGSTGRERSLAVLLAPKAGARHTRDLGPPPALEQGFRDGRRSGTLQSGRSGCSLQGLCDQRQNHELSIGCLSSKWLDQPISNTSIGNKQISHGTAETSKEPKHTAWV